MGGLAAHRQWEKIPEPCGFSFWESEHLAESLKLWIMKGIIKKVSVQIHHLVTPVYKSGKEIFFLLMPVAWCQELAFHLTHTATVLNSFSFLWTALLSAGNMLATKFWTEKHSERWAVSPSAALRLRGLCCVLPCTQNMVGQLASPPRFLSGQDSSGRNEEPLQRAIVLYKEVFFPLICQVPWAKLCAAPLPETRATGQVAEIKELRSWLCPRSGQTLQKTNLGAIDDVNVCDTKTQSTGNTKLPLPCMLLLSLLVALPSLPCFFS